MRLNTGKNIGLILSLLSICLCAGLISCKSGRSGTESTETFDKQATKEASELIADANDNLKRIKVLYHNSRNSYNQFLKALENRDSEKVRKLTTELSQIINDGYILAENAKEKIAEAQEKNINSDWREYLALKETSLDLQIKAFGFRRKSAELFRNKFGADDKATLDLARRTFMQNDESFKKYMAEAKKKNKEANDLAKKVAQREALEK